MKPKIIVLDDDPTGSQTVHGCLLLMQWDVETLRLGLADASPIFFVLTNTRALPVDRAEAVIREVCQNLQHAIALEGTRDWLVVSRSDSTLRGHYPLETDAIAATLGPFDAHFLVPAFFEGGRTTRDGVHYLRVDGVDTPVHETEFARDTVFGYRHSFLPDYVAEKTQGRIAAEQVERFGLQELRGERAVLGNHLESLGGNVCAVVDGDHQSDLDALAAEVLAAASRGKKFLFRSAASLLTSLAALPPQPIAPTDMGRYRRGQQPGAIIVGSHVQKTTEQLTHLLAAPGIAGVEVPVGQLRDHPGATTRADLLARTLEQVRALYGAGKTPVVYTSREELTFGDAASRLAFGEAVSGLLMDIERGLPSDLGFLISKGGITSNDTLSVGLALRSARLLGQILPGVSVVRTAADHPQFPELPVVLFPGNVGDATALATAYERLRA